MFSSRILLDSLPIFSLASRFEIIVRKAVLIQGDLRVSLKQFYVCLTFKSLFHLEIFPMQGMKHRTKFIFFQEWLFYETHILYLNLIFTILIWYLYHLYHLSPDLYHIDLISLSPVSFNNFLYMCLAHLRSILSLCPFGLFFYAAATLLQLRRLYRVCKLSGRTSFHSLLFFF